MVGRVQVAYFKMSGGKRLTEQECRDDLVAAGGETRPTLRATWCMRAFREFEGLYNVTLLVLTANRGLCGGFNSSIVRAARRKVRESAEREIAICSPLVALCALLAYFLPPKPLKRALKRSTRPAESMMRCLPV